MPRKLKKEKISKQDIKDWLLDNNHLLMYVDIQKESISESTDLQSLFIDSLDLIEIVMDFEHNYNIDFDDDKLDNLNTVGDFIDILYKEVNLMNGIES